MYLRAFGQATGTYPVFNITIDDYERGRAPAEAEAVRLNMTRAEWEPLLPVPPMNYIHDPETGLWYRAGDITTVAWEIMPPVVGGTPGTWQQGRILTDAEAAAWIAKVEATRQPFYGSVLTLPTRLGWTEPWTLEEINLWATALAWPNEIVQKFFESFPTREDAQAWIAQAQANPAMWTEMAANLFPPGPTGQLPGYGPRPPPLPPPA